MKNAFQCSNIVKRYDGKTVLDGVSLRTQAGDFFLLAGGNGAGKTVFLRAAAGIEEIDSGMFAMNGEDVTSMRPRLRGATLLPARDTLWPHLNATENITFPLRNNGATADIATRAAREALLALSLEQCSARLPCALSDSERLRLAIASMIAITPRLLLLDDAFATCAPDLRMSLLRFLKNYAAKNNLPLIAATANPAAFLPFADQVAVMDCGKILQCGTPLEVYHRPTSRRSAATLGAVNVVEGTLLHAGAGEFVARTPLGDLRGALANPAANPPPGTLLDLLIRPESLHVDAFPPEENAFPATPIPDAPPQAHDKTNTRVRLQERIGDLSADNSENTAVSEYHGATAIHRYRTSDGTTLRVLGTNPHTTTLPAQSAAASPLFLWVAPEDITGALRAQ
ncbi:MAG: ABC transporter ATP-binding protein [Puniceicoccales bacterium]|nr:ABC transporter ATP-binding protein [Puniceicoccales bacterium]